MAQNDVITRIQVILNAKQAENMMKQLRAQTKSWKAELKQLEAAEKGNSKRAQFLNQMIRATNNAEKETVTATTRIKNAVENLASTSTRELRRAATEARRFRDSLAANDPQFAKAQSDLTKIQEQIDKNTNAVRKHGSAWKTTIRNMFAYAGVFGMMNTVKSKIEEVISLNNKLSDQMANIRKVSNLPVGDIKQLTKEIYKQDTRTAPTELLDIAYSGAKLGFGEGGADQLAQFTRAANVVNVALKEDMGADALTALSKIVENMGLLKQMNVEDAMNKVGSSLFRLSSTSTATSTNIVEFAKRLTAMAKVAGVTTDQLLALGSASDAMYLAPEVAATAFTKLFSSLQKNHNLIENVLKIPEGTINDYFKQGRAMDAILEIFHKMHDLGNMNALAPIFKDLGSDGTRLMNVMTAMAKNVDMLEKHIRTSSEAYREGTAVLDEYAIQQETSQALMERANNLWAKTFINENTVDITKELAQAWYDLSKQFTSSTIAVFVLKEGLKDLINLLKLIVFLLPSVILGFGTQGLFAAWQKLAASGLSIIQVIRKLITAFKALSLATRANIVVAIASAVGFFIARLYETSKAAAEATKFMRGFNKEIKSMPESYAQSVSELESYTTAIKYAAKGTNAHKVAIQQFNEKFGGYLSKLLTETSTAQDLARAYEEVNSALQRKAYLELKNEDVKKYIVPAASHERNLGVSYDNFVKGTEAAGYSSKVLRAFYEDHRGMGLRDMLSLLNYQMFNRPLSSNSLSAVFRRDRTMGAKDNVEDLNPKKSQDIALYALRYLRAYGSLQVRTQRVNKKYVGLGLDGNKPTEDLGSLDNKAIDKDELARLKKEHNEAIRAANEAFKNAKEQATAVVSAIDEYYTLQKDAVEQMYNDGEVTRVKADSLKEWLEQRRLQVQVEAHKALGGRENDFENMKKTIGWGFDRVDQSSNSDASQKIMQNFNGLATYNLLARFTGGNGMPDGRSVINDINKKGAQYRLKLTEAQGKMITAVDTYFRQYDVVKDVSDDLAKQLLDMGIPFERPKNFFAGQGVKHKENSQLDGSALNLPDVTVTASSAPTIQNLLLTDFVKNGTKNYGFDVKDNKALGNWLKEFVTNGEWNAKDDADVTPTKSDFASWAKAMPDMEAWVADVPKYRNEILNFYIALVKADDDYYAKMKTNADRDKRVFAERWERSPQGVAAEQRQRSLSLQAGVEGIYGRGDSGAFFNTKEMARNNGFADTIKEDPNIMMVEEQMRTAQAKLEMMRQANADMTLIRQAEREAQDAELAYANKVNDAIKARMDLLQQWIDPLQQFSESVGEAFVKMADSASEGRDALKEATENMIRSFAKMTINMLAQQVKMEIQRALFHKRMLKSEKTYEEGMKETNESTHKSVFKALGSFFKKKKKASDKDAKDEDKIKKEKIKADTKLETDAANQKLEVTKTAEQGKANILTTAGEKTTEMKTEQAAADAQITGAEAQGNVFAGIASGAAKIIGSLGIFGLPLVAVIQGLLMGLLNSALSKLFGKGKSSSSSTNTKLVTGMLTYDSGNVSAFGGAIDGKTYPVVGNDGKVYAAKPTDELATGLITEPIATMIGGKPSLIAERGPEMIIGRETTAAMMMARPDIIRDIVEFDRNRSGRTYKVYDSGNIADFSRSDSVSSPATNASDMTNIVATLQAMMPAIQSFTTQLQKPIKAQTNMFGAGGLYEDFEKAQRFMRNKR